MNRREFIKRAAFFGLGFSILGTSFFESTAFAARQKIPMARLRRVHKVTIDIDQFKQVGTVILTLIYRGQLPHEITANVVAKNGVILGKGRLIRVSHPSEKKRIKQVSEQLTAIHLRISPELIDISKEMYIDLMHKGAGFQLEQIRADVEKPRVIQNKNTIEGYTPKVSYLPKEVLELKVHSPSPRFSVDFIRFGAEERVLRTISNIPGQKQNYPTYAYRNGLNWKTSLRFTIPRDWKTGLYGARLYDGTGNDFYISFNLKRPLDPALPKRKRIAVLSSTNTWQAYNTWGGASLYKYLLDDDVKPLHAQMVNTQRPNIEASPIGSPNHLANAEKLVLAWLERNHYPFHVISDLDLDQQPQLLQSFGTLIINTHGEYWTEEMYNRLEEFLDQGGNLVTLSGNAVYWKTVRQQHHLEVRKIFGYHTLTSEAGGLWRDVKRPESKILGVCYTPTGYMTFKPYRVIEPDHWIFQNTGLKKGDLIGGSGLNRGGASGHETDKMDSFSPKNTILLAKGLNPDQGGAEMVYYDHPGGGGVFSVGSVTFGGSLVVDQHLSQIMQNVLNRFTGESANELDFKDD